jgi:formylglycine-generating enzyme required for sulfatase activity
MIKQYNHADQRANKAETLITALVRERDEMLRQVLQATFALEQRQSTITHPTDHAELVFVPAALIVPGPRRGSEEEQQQSDRFVKAFYLDKYPVTNAQFQHFVESTNYRTVAEQQNRTQGLNEPTWRTPGGPDSSIAGLEDHPVVWVHWKDAWAYARWAGRRLPTRLEWERAMRGVAGWTWPWGNTWDATACNLKSDRHLTTPVDTFPTGVSPVGAWDMVGNVWEWLADERPDGKLLLMGGSWAEKQMDVGYRGISVPGDCADDTFGFRCAMDVPDSRTENQE